MARPVLEAMDMDTLTKGSNDGVYRYKVTRKFIVPEYFKLIDGVPEENSFLSLPKKGEKPLLTLFTCVYTSQGKERYVVQGELQ